MSSSITNVSYVPPRSRNGTSAFMRIMRRIAYSRTTTALSRLSDRELHDIGITRGEIDDVAQRVSRDVGR